MLQHCDTAAQNATLEFSVMRIQSEAQQILMMLGNIYTNIGCHGLCPESGDKLRALSQDVHDFIVMKERYQQSMLNSPVKLPPPCALENLLGKIRQAMIYFDKDARQPVMTV